MGAADAARAALYLVVRLGGDRYAIEATHVAEVLPLVRLKAMPGAPAGVAGMINYRGHAVPVIDLQRLTSGEPTPARLTARIVVVHYAWDESAPTGDAASARPGGLLGLLVPQAMETVRRATSDFAEPGIATPGAPHLGPVAVDAHGVLQRVSVPALLGPELRRALRIAPSDAEGAA